MNIRSGQFHQDQLDENQETQKKDQPLALYLRIHTKKGLPLKVLRHLNFDREISIPNNKSDLPRTTIKSIDLTPKAKSNIKRCQKKPRITVRNGNTRLDPRNNIRKFDYLQFNRIAVIKITRIATDLLPGREIGRRELIEERPSTSWICFDRSASRQMRFLFGGLG